MARAIWSGTVSFGLVAIPVSLVTAVRSTRIAFHLLHDKDYARLRREMVCPQHETVVSPEHSIRGYEYAPEKYVAVSDEEMRSLAPRRTRAIEISDFVNTDEISYFYYGQCYYLLPDGAEKAYRLLVRSLTKQHRAGIARFVLHDREHLVSIQANGEMLVLFMLHNSEEIISPEGLAPRETASSDEDIKSIEKIMDEMSGSFRLEKYQNRDQESLKKLLVAKEQSKEVVYVLHEVSAESDEEDGSEDLFQVLESSIARAEESRRI